MTAGAGDGGAAGPVVPVGRRVQREARCGVWEPHQELFDKETVVEDDDFERQGSGLLISEIRILDRRQAGLVAILEHSPQLLARHGRAPRYDQSRVTQIDEPDFTAVLDAPPPAQL